MVFLDNHKNVVGEYVILIVLFNIYSIYITYKINYKINFVFSIELWKYIVTYSNNNEIILWSCETWKRLQKLEFIRPYISDNPMKLTVDETGRYIFLSDIDHNVC
jgi:hypothetical protein